MDLSIVIPARNEVRKIRADVEAARAFVDAQGWSGEVIVVDDGSSDGTADAATASGACTIVIPDRRGKGFAARAGMAAVTGQYVLLVDSGGCVPLATALGAIEMIHRGECEIVHGSRWLPASVVRDRPWRRKILSALFRAVVGVLADTPAHLTDTQCGFKIYRGDVAHELYDACGCNGFMFDIEIILTARERGYRIVEIPIEWTCDPDSRTRVLGQLARSFRELRAAKRRATEAKDS